MRRLILSKIALVVFGSTHMPLAVALVIALVLGVVIGALCLLPAVIRARARARRMQGRLEALEKEVHNLRHVPLRDAR